MRLAVDLGWTPGCASSGVAPVCKLNPAIRGAFYNGYPNHGGPAHCSGLCHPHLHVSWFAASYGAAGLAPANAWVRRLPGPRKQRMTGRATPPPGLEHVTPRAAAPT